jgi:hypothetical protein
MSQEGNPIDLLGDWPLIPLPQHQPAAIYVIGGSAGGSGTNNGTNGSAGGSTGGASGGAGGSAGGSGTAGAIAGGAIGNQAYLVPRFSGLPDENVERFIETTRLAQYLNGWNDEQTLAVVRIRLDGFAADHITANNNVAGASLENLFKELRNRFGTTQSRYVIEHKFISCIQKPTESVLQYSSRLQMLARQLEQAMKKDNNGQDIPASVMEDRTLHQFLSGIRKDLRRFVLVRAPTNLSSALAAATAEEDAEAVAMGLIPNAESVNNSINAVAFAESHTSSSFGNSAMQSFSTQYNGSSHIPTSVGPATPVPSNSFPYQPVYPSPSPSPMPTTPFPNFPQPSPSPMPVATPQPANSFQFQTNQAPMAQPTTMPQQNAVLSYTPATPTNNYYPVAAALQSPQYQPANQYYNPQPNNNNQGAANQSQPQAPLQNRNPQQLGRRGRANAFCHSCGSKEHYVRSCPLTVCGHCGIAGHRPRFCPQQYQQNQMQSPENTQSKNLMGPIPPPLPR